MKAVALDLYPVRPRMQVGESLLGYLHQFFWANGHSMPGELRALADAVRSRYCQTYQVNDFRRVAGAERVDAGLSFELTATKMIYCCGEAAWRRWPVVGRHCPSCILEGRSHQVVFDLPLVEACPVHEVTVLPRPDGLPFAADAKELAYIHARARNRYKEGPVLGKDVGAKVRKLIDDHVVSMGVDPKIPPIQLTDADFDAHLGRAANDRAKASEMEHAIRSHIRRHLDEDPVRFRKLSERLNDILRTLGEQWNDLISQLQHMVDELRSGAAKDGTVPDDVPAHCAPFLRTVLDVVCNGQTPTAVQLLRLKDVTVELVDLLVQELQSDPKIWTATKRAAQEDLNAQVFQHLMNLRPPLVDDRIAGLLSDALIAQARAQHDKLVQL